MKKELIIRIVFVCGIGLCLVAALYCALYLKDTGMEHRRAQKQFVILSEKMPEEGESEQRLEAFLTMRRTYPDLTAWIRIPDTKLDYPVMQTPDEQDYYLHRNMDGEYSSYGVPYLQANCSTAESDNLIVYGHHMKNGDIFGSLSEYVDKSYWEEHPQIMLLTEDGEAVYDIFAVFKTTAAEDSPDAVVYHTIVKAEDSAAYIDFVKMVKEHSFYDTGITPLYGEQLLTLSTCEYTLEDGRLVVVARKKE